MAGWPDRSILDLFGIEHPIVQAPMAGATTPEMVVAACEAGGLGSLPCAMLAVEEADRAVSAIRERTRRPLNLNFFCHTPPEPDAASEAAWRAALKPYYDELGLDAASIPAGPVTMGQILEVLPFSNSVATAEVTGADLLKDLEAGVARAHDPNAPGTGRFPQVAGLRYSFAPAKPEGQRIQKVEVRDKAGSWAPLDPAATYTVFTNDFVRKGGDGYVNLAKAKVFYDYGPELEAVVADYIKARSPVSPALDGRITRVE